jgi:hypothetical protein
MEPLTEPGNRCKMPTMRARLFSMAEWTDYSHTNCCPCHTTRKLAYTIDEAAARVGCSAALLRGQIAHSYLLARYVNSKPIITHDDLVAWMNNLPTEAR